MLEHRMLVAFGHRAVGMLVALAAVQGTARAQTAAEWVAPQRASQRANPLSADTRSANTGKKLFERECQKCHGSAGHGDGPQAKFLDTQPGDLTSAAARSQSDGALFWKISEGRGRMPKAMLNERELWCVVNYVRVLQRKT